jgi:HAD superfamily hydrolase (TIGR01509 family)
VTAVIFDCDGTLVDSEPLAGCAWRLALARHGYALADDDLAGAQGLPFPAVHARFAQRARLPDVETFWRDYAAALLPMLDSELETFADAVATARELKAQGVPLAVASSSRRERLDRTLARAGLDGFFAVSVAGDEIEHGKPAPDMFLAVAERLGVEPAACVVIEDSPPGIAAGLAAGMATVGVLRDGVSEEALAGAHRIVRELTAGVVLELSRG